jgi:hypothetical protein
MTVDPPSGSPQRNRQVPMEQVAAAVRAAIAISRLTAG